MLSPAGPTAASRVSGFDLGFFFSSRRRHTRWTGDWSSDVCSSDLRSRSTTIGPPTMRPPAATGGAASRRSEERRVGKECRSRWWPDHEKKKNEIAQRRDEMELADGRMDTPTLHIQDTRDSVVDIAD